MALAHGSRRATDHPYEILGREVWQPWATVVDPVRLAALGLETQSRIGDRRLLVRQRLCKAVDTFCGIPLTATDDDLDLVGDAVDKV